MMNCINIYMAVLTKQAQYIQTLETTSQGRIIDIEEADEGSK